MGLALPGWVEEYIADVPRDAKIRGMFFRWVDDFCLENGLIPPREKRIDFKLYLTSDFLYYLCWALYPLGNEVGYETALRKVGQCLLPNFRKTLLGRSIFSGVLSVKSLLKVTPRGYQLLTDGSVTVSITYNDDREAVVTLKNLWVFNESLGLGTWEGVLWGFGVEGTVELVESNGRDVVTFKLLWPDEKVD